MRCLINLFHIDVTLKMVTSIWGTLMFSSTGTVALGDECKSIVCALLEEDIELKLPDMGIRQ